MTYDKISYSGYDHPPENDVPEGALLVERGPATHHVDILGTLMTSEEVDLREQQAKEQ